MRLLVIEDQQTLSESILDYLSKEGYSCEQAITFKEADAKLAINHYDCILLDITLPDGHGLSILNNLKLDKRTEGVIIISAKDSLEDRIKGLKLGADDYMAKPFHLPELSARIEALIRRKNFDGSNQINFNELTIDLPAHIVKVHGKNLSLTKKEYDLLIFLFSNKGKIISKNSIAEHLSGDMADMLDNHGFVYAHIKNLKKKLNESGCSDYIKTIYGFGYQWEA